MKEQTYILTSAAVVINASTMLRALPVDGTMEVVFRLKTKGRTLSQQALMWVGPLKDIADQGWVCRKQYDIEAWHIYLKRLYLPEDNDPEIGLLAKDGYKKWSYAPDGERELRGSTTQLTTVGMIRYIEQIEAYGAIELGVRFTTKSGL